MQSGKKKREGEQDGKSNGQRQQAGHWDFLSPLETGPRVIRREERGKSGGEREKKRAIHGRFHSFLFLILMVSYFLSRPPLFPIVLFFLF